MTVGWLDGWLTCWLAGWLDPSNKCMPGLAGRCRLADDCWLAGWLAGWLTCWLAGWLDPSNKCMPGLAGRCMLADDCWLAGWLAGWLTCWLAGWLDPSNKCMHVDLAQPEDAEGCCWECLERLPLPHPLVDSWPHPLDTLGHPWALQGCCLEASGGCVCCSKGVLGLLSDSRVSQLGSSDLQVT
jgi:hypothetical protein